MSKASEIRRSKSAKGSKNEKTKANAVKRRATKKAVKMATQDKRNPILERVEERLQEERSAKRNESKNTPFTDLV